MHYLSLDRSAIVSLSREEGKQDKAMYFTYHNQHSFLCEKSCKLNFLSQHQIQAANVHLERKKDRSTWKITFLGRIILRERRQGVVVMF